MLKENLSNLVFQDTELIDTKYPFRSLPIDCFYVIFPYCDKSTLLNCKLLNKHFNEFITLTLTSEGENIWKQYLFGIIPGIDERNKALKYEVIHDSFVRESKKLYDDNKRLEKLKRMKKIQEIEEYFDRFINIDATLVNSMFDEEDNGVNDIGGTFSCIFWLLFSLFSFFSSLCCFTVFTGLIPFFYDKTFVYIIVVVGFIVLSFGICACAMNLFFRYKATNQNCLSCEKNDNVIKCVTCKDEKNDYAGTMIFYTYLIRFVVASLFFTGIILVFLKACWGIGYYYIPFIFFFPPLVIYFLVYCIINLVLHYCSCCSRRSDIDESDFDEYYFHFGSIFPLISFTIFLFTIWIPLEYDISNYDYILYLIPLYFCILSIVIAVLVLTILDCILSDIKDSGVILQLFIFWIFAIMCVAVGIFVSFKITIFVGVLIIGSLFCCSSCLALVGFSILMLYFCAKYIKGS